MNQGKVGNKRKRGGPNGILATILIVLAIVCFLGSAGITYAYYDGQKVLQTMQEAVSASGFFKGTVVEGIDVSGMEYEEAKALVAQKLEGDDAARVIRVNAKGQEYSLTLPASHNIDETLVTAFNVGREGTLEERYGVIMELEQNGSNYTVDTDVNASGIENFLSRIERDMTTEAKDATVDQFDPAERSFTFTDEQTGEKIDMQKLRGQVESMVATEDYTAVLQAEFETLHPSITKEQLESQNKLLASFTTTTTNNSNRNANIKLCSSAFNGHVVAPGETFSINTLTGPRTAAKGYKDAGTIRGGILVDEPGGGVCQVSTTLFNAVVRAGLEIVERHNHSWPSDYVKIGMDAAIDYPAKDFKFTNTSDAPIYLVSMFSNNKLTVEVYGKPILEDGMTIELRSTTDSTVARAEDSYEFDASLAPGETVQIRKGRDGKNSTTYIQYVVDGKTVEEKVLFKSVYPPIRAKYAYGPDISTSGGGTGGYNDTGIGGHYPAN